ncbi:hypothetical protein GCM10009555_057210 [Acrocarpospora macrocephala]
MVRELRVVKPRFNHPDQPDLPGRPSPYAGKSDWRWPGPEVWSSEAVSGRLWVRGQSCKLTGSPSK